MSNDINESLSRAYDLIEEDRLQEAQAILEPVLAQHQNNPDAWWLYVHAVQDPQQAQDALAKLMQLDPAYPGAADMAQELETMPLTQAGVQAPQRLADMAVQQQADDILATLDDFDDMDDFGERQTPVKAATRDDFDDFMSNDEDDFGDFGDLEAELDDEAATPEQKTDSRRSMLVRIALIVGLLAFVLIAALLLLNRGGTPPDDDSQTLTQVAEQPTQISAVEDPEDSDSEAPIDDFSLTATAIIEAATLIFEPETPDAEEEAPPATQEAPTDEDSEESEEGIEEADLLSAFAGFELVEPGVETRTTILGETLLINVCALPGAALKATLDEVMDILASQSNSITGVLAVGARLVNCETDDTINLIAVPLETAQAFLNGEISERDFRGSWRAAS